MHKKRIKNRDYFYTTIREDSGKTKTIYLGSTHKKALQKEKEMGITHKKHPPFLHIFFFMFVLFSLSLLVGFSFTGFVTQDLTISDTAQNSEVIEEDIEIGEQGIETKTEEIPEDPVEEIPLEEEIIKPEVNTTEEDNETSEEPEIEINETIEINNTEEDNGTQEQNETEIIQEFEISETTEENTTILENTTELNETVEINQTIIPGKNITELYYDVIINQPVKWEKKVELEKTTNSLDIKIPKKAENITVTKITDSKKEKEVNLLTGNFFLDLFSFTGYAIYEEKVEESDEQTINVRGPLKGAILEYYMPGPISKEKQITDWKKQIIVSSEEHYENILTYTDINNIPQNSINLYHITEKGREKVNFVPHDKDEDGLVDYIEWITPHLSEEIFEVEISILNIQSYPTVGGNWTVFFNTTGQADLMITGINGTIFDEDLELLDVKCGETQLEYEFENNSIILRNYQCDNETGMEISKVLTPGRHHLEFNFGGMIAHAHNLATISTCQTLNIDNEYYALDADIDDDDGTCFTVSASNITLDCQGHYIDGDADTSGYGVIINSAAYDTLTIKNCTIKEFARNLYVGASSDDIRIENSNLIAGYYDGMLTYSVQNMQLIDSNFSGTNAYGAYIWHSSTIANTNITIRNCTFTGGNTASDYGLQLAYVDGLNITNSTFNGGYGTTYGYGANIAYLNNSIIQSSSFIGGSTDRDRGLYLQYGDNLTIKNNWFEDSRNDYPSGEFYGVDNSNISNNTFIAPLTYAAGFNYYSSDNIFDNNNLTSARGIYLQTYSTDNNLTNNHILSDTTFGVYMNNYATNNRIENNNITSYTYSIYATSYCSGTQIINNSMVATNAYGMYWNDHCGDNLVHNNNIISGTSYGIRAYLSSGGNNFSNNNITSASNTLRLESDSNDNYVYGNYLYSSTNLGIYVITGTTSGNRFYNNVIRGGTTCFQDSSVNTNLVFTNNTCTATNGYGTYVATGTNTTIVNNTIFSGTSNDNGLGLNNILGGLVKGNTINGTASGFLVLGGTNGVNFTNNTAWGALGNGNYYGLYLYQASHNNTFHNNSLHSYHYRGVYLDDAINNTFVGNHISSGQTANWDTDAGIYLSYSTYNNFTNNIINNTGSCSIASGYSHNNTFTDNILENGYCGIYINYGKLRQTDFANNQIINTSSAYDYRMLGNAEANTYLYFLNCSYVEDDVYITDDYSTVEQLWYGIVNVTNTDGQVENATVLAYDNESTLVGNETTDVDGLTAPIPLREYVATRLSNYNLDKVYHNNHTFQATESDHFSGSGEENMTSSKMIYITMQDWPLITILTNYPITQTYKANDILNIRANETRRNDLITATNITITFSNGTSLTFPMINGTDSDPNLWEYNYTINASDLGGDFNITALAYNTSGYNYINDTDDGFGIKPQIIWFKTFKADNKSKSFFAENESSKLKATVYNAHNGYPKISLTDSEGTTIINQDQMISENGTIYYVDYIINGTGGFYNTTIYSNSTNSEEFRYSHYKGTNWANKYTDNESNIFVFSKEVNITELDVLERYFFPVDIVLNLTESANVTSIRVLSYNGSIYTEIPSQVYNYTTTNDSTTKLNVVWLASLSQGENRTYHLSYNDVGNGNASYVTDLDTYTTTSNYRFFNNSYFKVRTDADDGALIDAAWTEQGTTSALAGQDPMQASPTVLTITLDSYSAHHEENPTRNLEYSGPILNKYIVTGYLSQSGETQNTDMPFNQTYYVYAKNNYLIYETDLNITSTYNLENLIDYFVAYSEGEFNQVAWGFENGSYAVNGITTGNGPDYTNLDISMIWLGLYNNDSKTAIGDIFLNDSSAIESDPKLYFYDQASYEFYKRYLISSPESVSAGSRYTTRIARLFWDGEDGFTVLNDTYNSIHSPLNASIGNITYGDTASPTYLDYNNTPTMPDDNLNVTCYSSWADDLRLKEGRVETNSTGTSTNHTISLSGNSADLNYTIPYSDLRGTQAYCKFYAKDIGNNWNVTPSISFTIVDVSVPNITNISNSPSDSDALDPGVLINVTANVSDKIKLNTAILQYKGPTDLTWNETLMANYSTDYYLANFTAITSGNYTYRINATDSAGNNYTSPQTIVNVDYDLSWTMDPTTFEAVSGLIGSTIEVLNLTINNTADYTANFTLTSTRDGWIYYNSSLEPFEFELGPQNSTTINVTAVLPVDIGEYTLTITATHENSTADPPTNTSIGTVVAYQSGPYVWNSFSTYSASVLLGATDKNFTVKIKNLGNETATGINNTITLPTGWSTSDSLTYTIDSLAANDYEYHGILVDISAGAEEGTQYINATPEANNTDQTNIAVQEVEVVNPIVEGSGTGTGTGGGGGGGGGGGAGLGEEESSRFFQSTEVFEITRGEGGEFTFILANPYDDASLEKIYVELDGFTKEYIHYFPNHIRKLRINDSQNITVRITAPGYFTRGEYELEFTIKGDVKKNATGVIPLTYTKKVLLYIREVSREDATEYRNLAISYLKEMEGKNFYIEEISLLVNDINIMHDKELFKEVKEIYEKVKEIYNNALNSYSGLQELEETIENAKNKNVDIKESERLFKLASTAFERGDYTNALERVNECFLTLAIEMGGQYIKEILYSMKSNKKETAAGATGFIFFIVGTTMFTRSRLLRRKIKKAIEEQKLLVELMKAIQIEVFEKAKMSMKEYGDAMTQYEARLNKVIEAKIMYETKKENMYKFKTRARKLKEEREKLVRLMSQAQQDYITKGKFETRVYENMLKSYSTRLSEVEEQIAMLDVKKAHK